MHNENRGCKWVLHLNRFEFRFEGIELKMDAGPRRRWSAWKNIKRRFGWKRIMGFCGSKWILSDDINIGEQPLMAAVDESPAAMEAFYPPPGSCIGLIPAGGDATMNLATALAADRRQINVASAGGMKMKPLKSLLRLFEDIDGRDVKEAEDDGDGDGDGEGVRRLCCLCTERNKGAALIPCGHTYCRVCSRELWLKQGSCPLCNRSIAEILEIF